VIEILLAFLFFWAVLLAGAQIERRRKRKPKLVCGCTHHLSKHNPKTGACRVDTVRFDSGNRETARLSCSCLIYTGDYPEDWQSRIMQIEMNRKELEG
jgi:hypothetical protein